MKWKIAAVIFLSWPGTAMPQDSGDKVFSKSQISPQPWDFNSSKLPKLDEPADLLTSWKSRKTLSDAAIFKQFAYGRYVDLDKEFNFEKITSFNANQNSMTIFGADGSREIRLSNPSINPDIPELPKASKSSAFGHAISATREALECYSTAKPDWSGQTCSPDGLDGRPTCAPFAPSEFNETVSLNAKFKDAEDTESCSGTIVAASWVLTAAHCVTPRLSAATINENKNLPEDEDAEVSGEDLTMAIALKFPGREKGFQIKRSAKRAIVRAGYVNAITEIHRDLALVELSSPFPLGYYSTALIAEKFSPVSTLVGYGYTDKSDIAGVMNLGWPPLLIQEGEMLSVSVDPKRTSFCFGDSGGPVFVGKNRGCDMNSSTAEARPRSIQGVISNLGAASDESTKLHACKTASSMHMEDLIATSALDWACNVTNNALQQCTRMSELVLDPAPNSTCDPGTANVEECWRAAGAETISSLKPDLSIDMTVSFEPGLKLDYAVKKKPVGLFLPPSPDPFPLILTNPPIKDISK